jgi:hypothetical protein
MSARAIPADRTVSRVSERRYRRISGIGYCVTSVTPRRTPSSALEDTAPPGRGCTCCGTRRRLAVTLTNPVALSRLALGHSSQSQSLVHSLALREVDRVVAHRFGAELGDGEVRRKATSDGTGVGASASRPLSANALARTNWESAQFGLISTDLRRLWSARPMRPR